MKHTHTHVRNGECSPDFSREILPPIPR